MRSRHPYGCSEQQPPALCNASNYHPHLCLGDHRDAAPASGTIPPYSSILNSTTITSNLNSFPAATVVTGPALPSVKRTIEHSPVNNFNAQEVSNFLNNSWKETLNQYYDDNIPESEKPEMHKSPWGARGGLVWGQRGHLMANGNDFFAELRKSSLSQATRNIN
ncbi:hypothetical protein C1645_870543 [Glomus cerebriforme]|uniref:Uncharacterized protein n=1 Tax=Glomus cerebriforme TaxID=658196 RepID=A0A397TU08_9GLOM|nr:hypothetical protein C1645_870543 [Glomus cerebriforme]